MIRLTGSRPDSFAGMKRNSKRRSAEASNTKRVGFERSVAFAAEDDGTSQSSQHDVCLKREVYSRARRSIASASSLQLSEAATFMPPNSRSMEAARRHLSDPTNDSSMKIDNKFVQAAKALAAGISEVLQERRKKGKELAIAFITASHREWLVADLQKDPGEPVFDELGAGYLTSIFCQLMRLQIENFKPLVEELRKVWKEEHLAKDLPQLRQVLEEAVRKQQEENCQWLADFEVHKWRQEKDTLIDFIIAEASDARGEVEYTKSFMRPSKIETESGDDAVRERTHLSVDASGKSRKTKDLFQKAFRHARGVSILSRLSTRKRAEGDEKEAEAGSSSQRSTPVPRPLTCSTEPPEDDDDFVQALPSQMPPTFDIGSEMLEDIDAEVEQVEEKEQDEVIERKTGKQDGQGEEAMVKDGEEENAEDGEEEKQKDEKDAERAGDRQKEHHRHKDPIAVQWAYCLPRQVAESVFLRQLHQQHREPQEVVQALEPEGIQEVKYAKEVALMERGGGERRMHGTHKQHQQNRAPKHWERRLPRRPSSSTLEKWNASHRTDSQKKASEWLKRGFPWEFVKGTGFFDSESANHAQDEAQQSIESKDKISRAVMPASRPDASDFFLDRATRPYRPIPDRLLKLVQLRWRPSLDESQLLEDVCTERSFMQDPHQLEEAVSRATPGPMPSLELVPVLGHHKEHKGPSPQPFGCNRGSRFAPGAAFEGPSVIDFAAPRPPRGRRGAQGVRFSKGFNSRSVEVEDDAMSVKKFRRSRRSVYSVS